jgi:hypothetical protein
LLFFFITGNTDLLTTFSKIYSKGITRTIVVTEACCAARREILESENSVLSQNREALNFIRQNGPDTLINCISVNFRTWDTQTGGWVMNSSLKKQQSFVEKLYHRCSHSIEKPSMADKGVQVSLISRHPRIQVL